MNPSENNYIILKDLNLDEYKSLVNKIRRISEEGMSHLKNNDYDRNSYINMVWSLYFTLAEYRDPLYDLNPNLTGKN